MPRNTEDDNDFDSDPEEFALDEEPASDDLDPESTPIDLEYSSSSGLASEDPIGIYMKEMSRVPLLSSEEEMQLAIRIEKGRKARHKIEQMQGKSKAPDRRKYNPLIEDGNLAREQLIKSNTRLVVSIAKRYMGRGVAFLDLIQEGNLGLMKAVEKYNYKLGFRFSTYATWWIRQTISRAISDQARTIRIPVHMNDRIRELVKANRELEQKLGRQPTLEELADCMGMDVKKVQWILRASWTPVSLESPVGNDKESEFGMLIPDDVNPSPMQVMYESMLKDKLEEALKTLSPREAHVLRLRFGLEDGRIYTLEEIGAKFGLTRERIRQIEGRALRQLRNPKRTRDLKDYL